MTKKMRVNPDSFIREVLEFQKKGPALVLARNQAYNLHVAALDEAIKLIEALPSAESLIDLSGDIKTAMYKLDQLPEETKSHLKSLSSIENSLSSALAYQAPKTNLGKRIQPSLTEQYNEYSRGEEETALAEMTGTPVAEKKPKLKKNPAIKDIKPVDASLSDEKSFKLPKAPGFEEFVPITNIMVRHLYEADGSRSKSKEIFQKVKSQVLEVFSKDDLTVKSPDIYDAGNKLLRCGYIRRNRQLWYLTQKGKNLVKHKGSSVILSSDIRPIKKRTALELASVEA